ADLGGDGGEAFLAGPPGDAVHLGGDLVAGGGDRLLGRLQRPARRAAGLPGGVHVTVERRRLHPAAVAQVGLQVPGEPVEVRGPAALQVARLLGRRLPVPGDARGADRHVEVLAQVISRVY